MRRTATPPRSALQPPPIFAIALLCLGPLASFPVCAHGNPVGAVSLADSVPLYESADSIAPAAAGAMATKGWKSPSRAFLYSFLGTAIPVGVGGATALGNNELSAGALVAIGGAIVGPSLGHFYAQRYGRAVRGIVVRGAAATIVAVTLTSETVSEGVALLSLGVFLVGVAFVVVDIAGASHSAHVHNQTVAERVGLSVAPVTGPFSGAPGLGIQLAY